MLCAAILLMCRHLEVWSPQHLCLEPHLQVGVLSGSYTGRRSLRCNAILVAQFGRRLRGLLLFKLIIGYDVWGERMLGSRWRCSGAFVWTSVYSWPNRMFAL